MNNKKAFTIVVLLGLEMIIYTFRFIKFSPESMLLPSDEVMKTMSNKKMFDKLNGACMSTSNFSINQGIFLNSENINGYNPIFPKRLLRIVNAIEGREPNWVETVSLNTNYVNGEIFQIAGVNLCNEKSKSPGDGGKIDNIFLGTKVVDDTLFYENIRDNSDIFSDGKISILSSDKQYIPLPLENGCSNKLKPTVEIIGKNKLKISSECDFYYVNPYLYFPGWFATDGKSKSKAFPAFGFLQGYRILAGNKQIEFIYFPSP